MIYSVIVEFWEFWDRCYLSLDGIKGIQNFLNPGVGSTNLKHNTDAHTISFVTLFFFQIQFSLFGFSFNLTQFRAGHENLKHLPTSSAVTDSWIVRDLSLMTHLEKDSNHSESIRLTGRLSKARVLSVPVHQVKLTRKRGQIFTSYPKPNMRNSVDILHIMTLDLKSQSIAVV